MVNTKLYVDIVAAAATEGDRLNLFTPYGKVLEVSLPVDATSGRSRGFAFVTMATPEGAWSALHALNGNAIPTCTLSVSAAWHGEQCGASPRRP